MGSEPSAVGDTRLCRRLGFLFWIESEARLTARRAVHRQLGKDRIQWPTVSVRMRMEESDGSTEYADSRGQPGS